MLKSRELFSKSHRILFNLGLVDQLLARIGKEESKSCLPNPMPRNIECDKISELL